MKSKIPKSARRGFTMIEFSLSVALLSVLLIFITIIANSISQIYQKGLSVKAVTSVGRSLVDEITDTIDSSPALNSVSLCNSYISSADDGAHVTACEDDRAGKFVFQHKIGKYTMPGKTTETSVQVGGVFCTGSYSYVWNTYYGLQTKTGVSLKYLPNGSTTAVTLTDFDLVRFRDPTYRACSTLVGPKYGGKIGAADTTPTEIDITALANGSDNPIAAPEQNFLDGSDYKLSLYELTIFPISQDQMTLRTFVSGTFILGTERGGVNIKRNGNFCNTEDLGTEDSAPDALDMGSEFTYCGINKFNFAARTAGI